MQTPARTNKGRSDNPTPIHLSSTSNTIYKVSKHHETLSESYVLKILVFVCEFSFFYDLHHTVLCLWVDVQLYIQKAS